MTLALKPFQEKGVDFLCANPRAFLGDDAGLGKSAQMIRAADRLGLKRVLIVCPAIGKVSWLTELPKWTTDKTRIIADIVRVPDHIPSGPIVVIVTYDFLAVNRTTMPKVFAAADKFDVVICDEAHYLKTKSAHRTRQVYGLKCDLQKGLIATARPDYIWLATATPRPNHVGEVYTHLRAVFPHILEGLFGYVPDQTIFEDRFCKIAYTNFGRKIEGDHRDRSIPLRDAFCTIWLARSKGMVMPELGQVQCLALPLDVDQPKLPVLDGAMPDFDFVEDDEDMISLAALEVAAASERRTLGEAKAPGAVKWIKEFLVNRPNKKLVVFAHHHTVLDYIVQSCPEFSPVVLTGGSSPFAKQHAVHAFQHDPRTRLFVGQNQAAMTSITLTAASDCLLVEPDWTPDNNYQMFSRLHRIGQTEPVTAWFAYADGTMDKRLTNVLRRKAEDAALFTGKDKVGHI